MTEPYHLGWYDSHIHILTVTGHWTWDDANIAINALNAAIADVPKPVYTVIHLMPNVNVIPKGGNALEHLRGFVEQDPMKEELCVFVGDTFLVQNLLKVVQQVYRAFRQTEQYRFATTLDEALTIIAAHRAENA